MVKQVIVVRKDLNMRKGKMIAQGAHASMKVFFDRKLSIQLGRVRRWRAKAILWLIERLLSMQDNLMVIVLDAAMREWVDGLFTKVVVSVDSEQDLFAIVIKAEDMGLPVALIQDAGRTEFGGVPTYTACAVGPSEADIVDSVTGHLKLL